MFTGIIEQLGVVKRTERRDTNMIFRIEAPFTEELKVDQSIAHNGVCLTVTEISQNTYTVIAIQETLSRTNMGQLATGDIVNLERCMKMDGRLDGHIVQGHVDQMGYCKSIKDQKGSWLFDFEYDTVAGNFTVEKGSICVNGVSLTVVDSGKDFFSVAIIPYTYENTSFKNIKLGDPVNLEFDIIGKYLKKLYQLYK